MATTTTDKENTHIHINEENVGNITKPNLLVITNFYQLKEKKQQTIDKMGKCQGQKVHRK